MTELIKFLVVSDIHAFVDKKKNDGSLLDYSGDSRTSTNPLKDLIKVASAQSIKVDALVCAGDICNKADPAGLAAAWSDLHCLASTLGNATLLATNGNHDLDSRHLTEDVDPDPKGALLALEPPFPFEDIALSNQYWARNFVFVPQKEDVLTVILNTSAYHGGQQNEIDHGRVSKKTIQSLCESLKRERKYRAYVLICHHHPIPQDGWGGRTDGEFILNGTELLNSIVSATGSSWLVVHGHRHQPKLVHGTSVNNDVPFVLGVGSLGARITGVSNQFHIVTLYESNESTFASISGVVETWSWSDVDGWEQESRSKGLPTECGFGYLGRVPQLAMLIRDLLNNHKQPFMEWTQVAQHHPEVKFLLPETLKSFERELDTFGLKLMQHRGRIYQVGA
ncbi:metallophosphoesterase family protein [Undibacterium danionis]|uniref:Metallophosphoesterase family protein n=1 Tax=Undibacterium danionis TaxID=1812100 RepID=A0ABV6IGS0_9BURK